ncbi:MAG: DUF1634 domain-containing protein, partial [bacterium]
MDEKDMVKPNIAGIVYGEIVYWGTLGASLLGLAGSLICFFSKSNVMKPSYLISMIWMEKSPADIWNGSAGSLPEGHWYLSRLGTGDGLLTFSISLGVFVVIPGMIAAAFVLVRKKSYLFGVLSFLSAVITIASMMG